MCIESTVCVLPHPHRSLDNHFSISVQMVSPNEYWASHSPSNLAKSRYPRRSLDTYIFQTVQCCKACIFKCLLSIKRYRDWAKPCSVVKPASLNVDYPSRGYRDDTGTGPDYLVNRADKKKLRSHSVSHLHRNREIVVE